MSLISIRNAVAPLTNTTHLVTIVLFTVLFGVYRVSGGTIRVSESGSHRLEEIPAKPRVAPTSDFGLPALELQKEAPKTAPAGAVPLNKASKIPDSGSVRLQPSEDGDLLQEMIGNDPLPNARRNDGHETQRRPVEKRVDQNNGSLDDIEKTLGLK